MDNRYLYVITPNDIDESNNDWTGSINMLKKSLGKRLETMQN